jgi:hypothetical protein
VQNPGRTVHVPSAIASDPAFGGGRRRSESSDACTRSDPRLRAQRHVDLR